MPTYRQIVKAAAERLSQHEAGKLAHVADFWDAIQWIEHPDQLLKTDTELSRTGEAFVNLYPSLQQHADPVRQVLIEFGLYVLHKGGNRAKALWENKLVKPAKEHIQMFADRLADPEVRRATTSYDALVQAYPDKGHAVARLVAVHLSNALIHQNIPFTDSQGVNVYKWGPTTEFANGRKYFSLTPLLSAYAPRSINDCFGCAFADYVLTGFDMVIESSVKHTLREVMLNVIQRSV